jgi:hypothetical protein
MILLHLIFWICVSYIVHKFQSDLERDIFNEDL